MNQFHLKLQLKTINRNVLHDSIFITNLFFVFYLDFSIHLLSSPFSTSTLIPRFTPMQ